ncbi:DUF3492 domain-containing protein [Kitasatospora sp. LaBMicrA B282]|uniref:DUF3492 domain-containing protein n=1 Tax=Kitasatospora sp. LaBMicrA B282 TaxID=3420949 RepID=UPI003D0B280B
MRIALLTEGRQDGPAAVVRPEPGPGNGPERDREGPGPAGAAGWGERLAAGLPEHEFERYLLLPGAAPGPAPQPGVHRLALGGPARGGRGPGTVRRRHYAQAYEDLVRALVQPRERAGFAVGLHALAELTRQDGALPAFLASDHAHRVLERVWRSPGADTAAGQPLLRDVLVAGDLLEQCLRPLTADWYGSGPGGLGGVDLCHVVGGGPAALPALVAKQLYGVPFVLTEHGLHLREQYLGYRQAPYRWPVRALLLSYFRQLTAETYRQAALLTPGSGYDREWQLRCGAEPDRIRVVYQGTAAVDRPAAGPEPAEPTLLWSGRLEPAADPELMLHAFARVRTELPAARLLLRGPEGRPGHREHLAELADRLKLTPAVTFAEAGEGDWTDGTVAVFSGRARWRSGALVGAMLSGRAVIATDVGATRELLGPAGLLVPPGDPAALAVACRALLADRERRSRLGLAGRLRAQERFAVEPAVAAFREVYLELVTRWPAYPAVERRAGALPRPFARPAEYWVAGGRPRQAAEAMAEAR